VSRDDAPRRGPRSAAAGPGHFAARAEALRRQGRPVDAEREARAGLAGEPESLEGAVALALALLDQSRVVDARRCLEDGAAGWLAAPAPAAPLADEVSDAELDRAFAAAEPEADELVDADRIAQQAMREADRQLAEELAARPGATFATRTLADLLERQGDPGSASRVRAAIAPRPAAGRREQVISRLEGWLENLRRPREAR
jgi:hypothetical protein